MAPSFFIPMQQTGTSMFNACQLVPRSSLYTPVVSHTAPTSRLSAIGSAGLFRLLRGTAPDSCWSQEEARGHKAAPGGYPAGLPAPDTSCWAAAQGRLTVWGRPRPPLPPDAPGCLEGPAPGRTSPGESAAAGPGQAWVCPSHPRARLSPRCALKSLQPQTRASREGTAPTAGGYTGGLSSGMQRDTT